jgi:hypothetical protein
MDMEGDRLYYSKAHPNGEPVDNGDKRGYKIFHNVPGGLTETWNYKAYEKTVQHGSVVVQWDFKMHDYYGTWWAWAKSVKFDKTRSSYRFGEVRSRAKPAYEEAWTA